MKVHYEIPTHKVVWSNWKPKKPVLIPFDKIGSAKVITDKAGGVKSHIDFKSRTGKAREVEFFGLLNKHLKLGE